MQSFAPSLCHTQKIFFADCDAIVCTYEIGSFAINDFLKRIKTQLKNLANTC